jgi:hypothetical protein
MPKAKVEIRETNNEFDVFRPGLKPKLRKKVAWYVTHSDVESSVAAAILETGFELDLRQDTVAAEYARQASRQQIAVTLSDRDWRIIADIQNRYLQQRVTALAVEHLAPDGDHEMDSMMALMSGLQAQLREATDRQDFGAERFWSIIAKRCQAFRTGVLVN